MPMTVRVDHVARCLIVRSEGPTLDDAALGELLERMQRDLPEAGGYAALFDLRSITHVNDLSNECVRTLAGEQECGSESEPQQSRVAIVARTDALFGVGRMFQTLSDGRLPELRVFREIEAAREYVGLAHTGAGGGEAPLPERRLT